MSQPKVIQRGFNLPSLSQFDGVPRPPLTLLSPQTYFTTDLRSGTAQQYVIASGKYNWLRLTLGGGGAGGNQKGGSSSGGAGGGGGACCQSPWINLAGAGLAILYTVGIAGIGSATTTATNGGDTTAKFTFQGITYNLIAGGGKAGTSADGLGGTASGGLYNFSGGAAGSGGGGGAAGPNGAGGAALNAGTGLGGGGGYPASYAAGGGGIGATGWNGSNPSFTAFPQPGAFAWGSPGLAAVGGDWGGGGSGINSTSQYGNGGLGGIRVELS